MSPPENALRHSVVELLTRAANEGPNRPAVHYFDRTLTYGDIDRQSTEFAVGLSQLGMHAGDRVGLLLQNIPQFPVALFGIWKAGGVAVPLNPMYTPGELLGPIEDSGTRFIVCLDSLYPTIRDTCSKADIRGVVVTSAREYLAGDVLPFLDDAEGEPTDGAVDWNDLLQVGCRARDAHTSFDLDHPDIAMLCYTSGTTGPPKGAMNSHANVMANVALWQQWMDLSDDDVILALAPLFHITGMMGHLLSAVAVGAPLILMYRFSPEVAIDLTERWQASFTVAPITAFIALMDSPRGNRETLGSLRKIVSGGAPVPPAVVARFQEVTGHYIHNGYGLTESTSVCIGTPLGSAAPVDSEFGALAIGHPMPHTDVRIIDSVSRADVEDGETGEIVVRGPQVVAGYWQKPEETAATIRDGWLHTGDVGRKDRDGWIYTVDRIKDVIIVSGYKVWPREVEDVLHSHPAVAEAAVVGVPDNYRGEIVKAFVSLRADVSLDSLIDYCKTRLAAYKYPRQIEIVDEVPKTASGKYLRRELRQRVKQSRET